MKRGTQAIETRQPWCGECLKWICGFAIAQGGKLVVCVDDATITACVADELEWRLK